MTSIRYLDDGCSRVSGSHLTSGSGEQEVRESPPKHEHGTSDVVPCGPELCLVRPRKAKCPCQSWIIVQHVSTGFVEMDAVSGEVLPLLVRELSEWGEHITEV